MIDELRDEKLIEKVGGRFQLSALIQKRLVFLNNGACAYVDSSKKNKLEVVIQEIVEDKIYLSMDGEVCARDEDGNDLGPIGNLSDGFSDIPGTDPSDFSFDSKD